MQNTQRIIGKHALILVARGLKEVAAQVFVYDHIREIRVDTEEFEVKILMDYDESYFRVFKIQPNNEVTKEQTLKIVLEFYNNLLNASMKLTDVEIKNIRMQREQQMKKVNENLKKTNKNEK